MNDLDDILALMGDDAAGGSHSANAAAQDEASKPEKAVKASRSAKAPKEPKPPKEPKEPKEPKPPKPPRAKRMSNLGPEPLSKPEAATEAVQPLASMDEDLDELLAMVDKELGASAMNDEGSTGISTLFPDSSDAKPALSIDAASSSLAPLVDDVGPTFGAAAADDFDMRQIEARAFEEARAARIESTQKASEEQAAARADMDEAEALASIEDDLAQATRPAPTAFATKNAAAGGFDMDALDDLAGIEATGAPHAPATEAPTVNPEPLLAPEADEDAFDMDELEALAMGEASSSGDEDGEGEGEARGELAPPNEPTEHEKLAAAVLETEDHGALDAAAAESRTPRRGGLVLALAERAAARAANGPEAAGKALRRVCEAMGPWGSILAERLAQRDAERGARSPAHATLELLERESRANPDPALLAESARRKARSRRSSAP